MVKVAVTREAAQLASRGRTLSCEVACNGQSCCGNNAHTSRIGCFVQDVPPLSKHSEPTLEDDGHIRYRIRYTGAPGASVPDVTTGYDTFKMSLNKAVRAAHGAAGRGRAPWRRM